MTNHPNRSVPLRESNAELLAAAKMALDALDNLTSQDFSLGRDKPARDALRAAIAKAEGRA